MDGVELLLCARRGKASGRWDAGHVNCSPDTRRPQDVPEIRLKAVREIDHRTRVLHAREGPAGRDARGGEMAELGAPPPALCEGEGRAAEGAGNKDAVSRARRTAQQRSRTLHRTDDRQRKTGLACATQVSTDQGTRVGLGFAQQSREKPIDAGKR